MQAKAFFSGMNNIQTFQLQVLQENLGTSLTNVTIGIQPRILAETGRISGVSPSAVEKIFIQRKNKKS